jgi:hypothetical protein
MTAKKQSTKKGGTKGKGRGSKGKARTITPEQEAEIRARVDTDSAVAHPLAMEAYTNLYGLYLENADALKLARRVVELFAATGADGSNCTAGGRFLMEAADDVTTSAGEGAMLSSPLSDFFIPFFVKAVRGLAPDYHSLVQLKDIIKRVDAGEDLEAIAEEEKAQGRERGEAYKVEQSAKPEPKDKTSDEWRYWKLRQVESAFDTQAGNSEAYNAAHDYFRELLTSLYNDEDFYNASHILALLPQLIIARQSIDETNRYEHRMRAGMKGAQTRKANKAKAAKKGGIR